MESTELYKNLKNNKFVIAGPCVIENEKMVMHLAENIQKITQDLNLTYIFKASFDKANRTSIKSYRGPGLIKGLKILEKVKKEFNLSITTDIHESRQAKEISEVIDIIQIPAFLSRQTDLLVSAGKTNCIINIKKAQFVDGKDMIHSVNKVLESGNRKVMLTERGTMFGLGNLVVDFRQLIDMKSFGYPVIMDVTHSNQKPGSLNGKSGGDRKYALEMTKLANSIDVNGFFYEVHQNPEISKSDGPNMIYLNDFKKIIKILK